MKCASWYFSLHLWSMSLLEVWCLPSGMQRVLGAKFSEVSSRISEHRHWLLLWGHRCSPHFPWLYKGNSGCPHLKGLWCPQVKYCTIRAEKMAKLVKCLSHSVRTQAPQPPQPGMVVHAHNPSPGKLRTAGSLELTGQPVQQNQGALDPNKRP